MKQFATAALIGATYVEGRKYSQNTVQTVSEIKRHFEKTFGAGLVGMFNDKGEVHGTALAKAARKPQKAEWIEMGGISFNGNDAGSILYGITNGMQYDGLEASGPGVGGESALVESNCFYGAYGLLESTDQLMFDFDNIVDPSGEVKWFDLVFYNPLNIVNNFSVAYETCEGYAQLDKLSDLFGLDYALAGDYIATDLTFFLTDAGQAPIKSIGNALSCGAVDAIEGIIGDATDAVDGVTEDLENLEEDEDADATSGWDGAIEDAEGLTDSVTDAIDGCEPNFFVVGKELGNIFGVALKQKLEESKLP